jgi:hypothetical protein
LLARLVVFNGLAYYGGLLNFGFLGGGMTEILRFFKYAIVSVIVFFIVVTLLDFLLISNLPELGIFGTFGSLIIAIPITFGIVKYGFNMEREMTIPMIQCEACHVEISKQAEKCPHCGHPNKSSQKQYGCLHLIGLILVIVFFASGGLNKQVERDMQEIENKVASDAVAQFQIAKAQGDKMQICVQAGLVSAAYLQAKDTANYNAWKEIEKGWCKVAGLPY